MQMHKIITTLTLVAMIGRPILLQATPKQQREFLENVSTQTSTNSQFSELPSNLYEAGPKVQTLIQRLTQTTAMAENSDAWHRPNRSTLSGTANNATVQVSKQLHKEKALVNSKIKKINDAVKLIQQNIEQANKIVNDNRIERENRFTTAVQEIGNSMVPMTKIDHERKKAQTKTEPKPKKVVKRRRNADEQYGGSTSHKSKMASDNKGKKTKSAKKEKKSKKSKKNADEIADTHSW